MNNPNTILIMLAVLILGGFLLYSINDRWHMDTNDMEEMHDEVMGHHDDDDDYVESYEIYPGDVADKIKDSEDIILLDVRTPEEYETVHLENALLLPVQELSQRSLNQIGLGENMKDKEIILYCRSGARSKTAYDIMKSLGYTNIKSVGGGMIHWEEDNYPFTETGEYKGSVVSTVENADSATPDGPKITIDRTLHDFGVISQFGGTVEADFIITNSGTEILEIGQLTTSCSCTAATISNSSINPGDEATLTVVFDPDFHEEPIDVFKRTVFIPTNDLSNKEAEVAVRVDIAEGE